MRGLLDYGRQKEFETDRQQLSRITIDTHTMIRKLLDHSDSIMIINVPDDLYLQVDSQRIQQLLINLLQNSIHAGGNKIKVSIEAEKFDVTHSTIPEDAHLVGNSKCLDASLSNDQYIKITVSDDGPGIEKENIGRIFDPFYTTSEPGHGVGLGLYIVQEIVNEHDGCLAITSTPGKGTQVIILLPEAVNQEDGGFDE